MSNPFGYFKTSSEIIRLAVMKYVRFPFSLQPVEDLLHETVRAWWNRFGPVFANEISKRRIQGLSVSLGKLHLDEVFVRINGELHYLWQAVDHEGEVLKSFITKQGNRKAALQFIRKALKRYGARKGLGRTYFGLIRRRGKSSEKPNVRRPVSGSIIRLKIHTSGSSDETAR